MKEINEELFRESINQINKLVVIDFYATWCGPCQILMPKIDEISKGLDPAKAVIYKVDVDDNPNLCTEFKIKDIPTMIFIRNGKEVDRLLGANPVNKIEETIAKHS